MAASLLSGRSAAATYSTKEATQRQLPGDLNLAQKREPPRPPPFPSTKSEVRERRLRAVFVRESSSGLGPAPRAVHHGTRGRRLCGAVLAVGAAEATEAIAAVPAERRRAGR